MHLSARLISYYNPISAFFQELKLQFKPAGISARTGNSPTLQGITNDLPELYINTKHISAKTDKLLLNLHPVAASFFAVIHLLVSPANHLIDIPVIVRTNAPESNGDGNILPLTAERRFLNLPAHPV